MTLDRGWLQSRDHFIEVGMVTRWDLPCDSILCLEVANEAVAEQSLRAIGAIPAGKRYYSMTVPLREVYESAANAILLAPLMAPEPPLSVDDVVRRFESAFSRYHGTRSVYLREDIVNLFLCLTQSFLTVLSGGPGTGKISTCDILALALGLTDAGDAARYALVSVEKDWSSKRDLVGYRNPFNDRIVESNHRVYGALKALSQERAERLEAGEDPLEGPPFILALDEANLSPMEYYWADFMAACDNRIAVGDGSDGAVAAKPVHIDIGGESVEVTGVLRFLATINNDHTTEKLSPRLLDRA